jgi:hypothetical protein
LADHLALLVKNHHADAWTVFCEIPGQARRDRLNAVTEEILTTVTKLLSAK